MKWIRAMLVTALAVLALSVGLALAYEVPKDIVIERPQGNQPLAEWVGPVKFPHGSHAVWNACQSCHHKQSDKNLGKFVPCVQCHKNPDPENASGFYLAWHNDATFSCLGCHRKVRLEQPDKMPPLSCTAGCHPKK